ncbi:hypothetical protein [Marinifilum caeruleilacunae]|uniref:Uncharacterized protein n=1 Tax=Marinifilum caeruleilacunae TaxID=2499076 RepID=A0ABX1WR63_9BACT|nr:hypothetical protein [Marinifilum caeruleilacunae]NOU58460.1 hypothetical protein [Marinifilum caeruleilacunae]
MHPIFCFIGGGIRFVILYIQSIITGKERPKYMMVCQNKSNAWFGFLLIVPLLLLYLLIYHW